MMFPFKAVWYGHAAFSVLLINGTVFSATLPSMSTEAPLLFTIAVILYAAIFTTSLLAYLVAHARDAAPTPSPRLRDRLDALYGYTKGRAVLLVCSLAWLFLTWCTWMTFFMDLFMMNTGIVEPVLRHFLPLQSPFFGALSVWLILVPAVVSVAVVFAMLLGTLVRSIVLIARWSVWAEETNAPKV